MGSYFAKESDASEVEFCQNQANWEAVNQAKKPKNISVLKDILKSKIKMNEDLLKENNAILLNFLESFINTMKICDNLFQILFNRLFFTGSFYDGLRISMPDEYDINVVLKLPFKAADIEVEIQNQAPSWVKYKIKNPANVPIAHEILLKTLFVDGYLNPEKLRKWFQGVVDKAMICYNVPPSCKRVGRSASGPARTVILQKKTGGQIDIDLVPVFENAFLSKPNRMDGRVWQKVEKPLQYFLVPKPYQTQKQPPINPNEISKLWRTHFPTAERAIIKDKGCVKPLIKLLKLLRDEEVWKILASYYLKTIVMWMVIKNPNDDYWKEDLMGERFIDALENLALCVQKKEISYFFNSNYNLLVKMHDEQSRNISQRLLDIIKNIKKDPCAMYNFFNVR